MLLKDQKNDNLVIVEVEKDIQTVSEKIEIIKKHFGKKDNQVQGIIIKQSTENKSIEQIENKNIKILNYRLKLSIPTDDENDDKNEEKAQYDIQPDSEKALSDYLGTHLNLFEGENLISQGQVREHKIKEKDRHSIDIFCRDKDNKYVIIENKKYDEGYKVVGQVLYYINQVIKKHLNEKIDKLTKEEKNKVRAIILMSKNNQNSQNVETVRSALECCSEWNIIQKFYTLKIIFEKQH